MSFELLDTILLENKEEEKEEEKDKKEEECEKKCEDIKESDESDSIIYASIDNLIEDAMRETLRYTIMESAVEDSKKLKHLNIIENAVFSEEQMSKYVMETIHPILEMSGALEENSEDFVSVSIPVYEVAKILHFGSLGRLSENHEEFILPEEKDESLYESIIGTTQDENKKWDITKSYLKEFFEFNDVKDNQKIASVLDEASNNIVAYGFENLRPSLFELAELVVSQNLISESNEEVSKIKLEILGESTLEEAKNIGAKVKEGIKKGWERSEKAASEAIEKIKNSSKKTKSGAAIAGGAALATAGALAYRKMKDSKCKGLSGDELKKCKSAAATKAAKMTESYMKACPDQRCLKESQKILDSWILRTK